MSWITFERPKVSISLTADQWELYDNPEFPGREEFAAKLNKIAEDCYNHGNSEDEFFTNMMVMMRMGASDFGSMDSEPMYRLDSIAMKLYHKDEWR